MDTLAEILNLADEYEHQLPEAAEIPPPPVGVQIAGWIDHTLLKPEATAAQVKVLCQEALQHRFASVCVNPAYVPLVSGLLAGSPVLACSVVGFPLGATLPTQKVLETLSCLENGAAEIDMVVNIGALKGEAYGLVYNEVQAIAQVTHNHATRAGARALVKVILETALLTRKEKIIACLVCRAAGADIVKTSTGFGPGGATVKDVDLMYRLVGPQVKVKASGGIRSLETALAMIRAGATRLGTSSGVQIVKEAVA